jgi:tetratricopeptide (TPR) repeat protein
VQKCNLSQRCPTKGTLMKSVWILVPALLLSVVALAQTSDDELKLGVEAYKESRYEQAIQHFEKATDLDPGNLKAHLYLATAYVSQYIPGVDSPDNLSCAEKSIAHCQRVLDSSSDRTQRANSAKGIAYLYLNMKKWDDARSIMRSLRMRTPRILSRSIPSE